MAKRVLEVVSAYWDMDDKFIVKTRLYRNKKGVFRYEVIFDDITKDFTVLKFYGDIDYEYMSFEEMRKYGDRLIKITISIMKAMSQEGSKRTGLQ